MSKLNPIHYFQILQFVEYTEIIKFTQINKKCQKITENLKQVKILDKNIGKLHSQLNYLHIKYSKDKGEVVHNELIKESIPKLTVLQDLQHLNELEFDSETVVNYPFLDELMKNIPDHSLSSINYGLMDDGPESVRRIIDVVTTNQTSLKSFVFWKNPGPKQRCSQPDEVTSITNLKNLEYLKLCVYSHEISTLTNLTKLNCYFGEMVFDDYVDGMKNLKQLQSLVIRSNSYNDFNNISRVTELTQLKEIDLSATNICKDLRLFKLHEMPLMERIYVYYIAEIGDEIFTIIPDDPRYKVTIQSHALSNDLGVFSVLSEEGRCFSPKQVTWLHCSFFQKQLTSEYASTLKKRYGQYPHNIYIRLYDEFSLNSFTHFEQIENTLLRLEIKSCNTVINFNGINKLTSLTALNIIDSNIETSERISLKGLQFLKRMTIDNVDKASYLRLSDLTSLTSFKFQNQRKLPNLQELYVLPALKHLSIINIIVVSDQEIMTLAMMYQVQHFTFEKFSTFHTPKWQTLFEQNDRTVAYVEKD